jgi:4-alpha-glucanotransferase
MTGFEGRTAGILLHITSLPGRFGIGDLGPEAHRFADWLHDAGQQWWQVLPLNPTDPGHDNSPYRSVSAFAISPLLISPEALHADGLLVDADIADISRSPRFRASRTHYTEAAAWKERLLDLAFHRFRPTAAYRRFCAEHADWLDNYALFTTLKRKFDGIAWADWPSRLRDCNASALAEIAEVFKHDLDRERFIQFVAFRQWHALRARCEALGIRILGDLPFYVDHDSADVWANPSLFKLGPDRRPRFVAGVPPDRFSKTGQLWHCPVYDWRALGRSNYAWLLTRVGHNLKLFDRVRIDHFRGLVAYWRIPARKPDPARGRWVKAPAVRFLTALRRSFPDLPFVAEDLGLITPAVTAARDRFGLPGVRVLLFAFDHDPAASPHAPQNVPANYIYYTGTHDNNTVRGWLECDAGAGGRRRAERCLGERLTVNRTATAFARAVFESRAAIAILPLQDVLGLGAEARMNHPGTTSGNWEWRLTRGQLTRAGAHNLRRLVETCGRA